MNNQTDISSDGVCVYINSKVGALWFAKVILIVLNLILISFSIFFATFLFGNGDKSPGVLLFLTVFGLVYFFTLGKYTLWNLWGKEFILVNNTSISYQYDYGFYQTKLKTLKFNVLGSGFEYVRDFDGVPHGKINFHDYDENKIPHQILSSTVLMTFENLEQVDPEIVQVFSNEFQREQGFIPFSQN